MENNAYKNPVISNTFPYANKTFFLLAFPVCAVIQVVNDVTSPILEEHITFLTNNVLEKSFCVVGIFL